MTARLAIVDDDLAQRELVAEYLRGYGFEPALCDGGAALRRHLAQAPVDLVVLDLVMPGEDGLSVLAWLRANSDAAVIMLTANDTPADRIVGLELGADDYVAKPADLRELLARIRSILRRRGARAVAVEPPPTSAPVPAAAVPAVAPAGSWFGRWRLDRERHRLVDRDGEVCPITAAEYGLLAAFADHPRVVLSREKLLELSGTDPGEVFDRAIDLRITRLRKKIEPVPGDPTVIRTVRGHGGGYEYVPSTQPDYGR